MEGVRCSRRAKPSPLVIASEGNDVKCRRAIEMASTDSISLAEAGRRCGVKPSVNSVLHEEE
jgi:hypothetical protein